jgi:hypothetical protein
MFNPSPELLKAFLEIQQPRSRYVLEQFVVGQKLTPEAHYAQCVLEAQNKWDSIRTSRLELEKKDLEIAAITTSGRLGEIEKELKLIEKEQIERAMLGAERELACLCDIFEEFPEKFQYEQLQKAQALEHQQRICLQAIQDVQAFGYPTPGNQDALRMIKASLSIKEVDGKRQITVELVNDPKELGPCYKTR